MNNEQIEKTYKEIKVYYDKYLKNEGVKMPQLKWRGKYSRKVLVLVYLYQGYPNTKVVTKTQLTQFLQKYFDVVDDVQQARHLGKQDGWYIDTGTRNKDGKLKNGEYKLITLEKPLPGYLPQRRKDEITEEVWVSIKRQYGKRCACCGSVEGQPNIYAPTSTTQLQKGHMNPFKEMTADNVIPQCSLCNQPDKSNWIYDKTGRVVAVADPLVIEKSPENVQRKIYEMLKAKYEK